MKVIFEQLSKAKEAREIFNKPFEELTRNQIKIRNENEKRRKTIVYRKYLSGTASPAIKDFIEETDIVKPTGVINFFKLTINKKILAWGVRDPSRLPKNNIEWCLNLAKSYLHGLNGPIIHPGYEYDQIHQELSYEEILSNNGERMSFNLNLEKLLGYNIRYDGKFNVFNLSNKNFFETTELIFREISNFIISFLSIEIEKKNIE